MPSLERRLLGMMNITNSAIVSKRITVEYGHVLPDYMGFCNQLHGHRGEVIVKVKGQMRPIGSERGMVMDFSYLKRLMMEYIHDKLDHAFCVWKGDVKRFSVHVEPGDRIISLSTLDFVTSRNDRYLITDEPPTSEYLAKWCYHQIQPHLPKDVQLMEVTFYETENSFAVYCGE
jgi:6-pyruvoyltetrahydropterin/6-carboxytetrahydropterin synthase